MTCVVDRAISELILHCEQRYRLHETISTLKNPVLSGNKIMIDFFYNAHEYGNRTTHKRRKLVEIGKISRFTSMFATLCLNIAFLHVRFVYIAKIKTLWRTTLQLFIYHTLLIIQTT